MNLSEYAQYDALGLAALVRSREVSAAELTACAREAIETLNPQVNAVIEQFDPAEAGGKPDAPFFGVPFLVKDLVVHAAGRRCEMGSRLALGMVADHDTHLMQRFRAAGLHTVGRTQAPEFGYCPTTETVAFGPVHNPWALDRMPGGSSGGSAAAVAAGMVPIAHANDGGGSIRLPAHCCGLVGLKPTRGRVPIGPDAADGLNGLAAEFVVSRTVRDSALLLDLVHGAEPGDPYVITPPARPYADVITRPPGRLRIAWTDRPWSGTAVDPQVQTALAATVRLCAAQGHELVEARPEFDYEDYINATHVIWTANLAGWVDLIAAATGREINQGTLESTTLACWEHGRSLLASDLLWAFGVMNTVSRSVAPFFTDHDLLLTPTAARPALPLGEMNANDAGLDAFGWTQKVFEFAPFTALFNMTGQPAVSLPLARTGTGLPIGMQFAGRWGDEATLLAIAAQLEQAAPWPQIAPLPGQR
ncbi:MAG: amidase [Gammaproteobacteria bacterium]|nr:amidase [Gammaproteobacteria bacterium]